MEKTIEKIDIRSLNYKELQEEMTRIGEKAFRGKQIYEWLHVKLDIPLPVSSATLPALICQ